MLYLFERIADIIEEAGLFVKEKIAIAQDPTSWPGAGRYVEECGLEETVEDEALEGADENEESNETSDFGEWLRERAVEALSIPILTVDPEDVLESAYVGEDIEREEDEHDNTANL